MGTDAQIFDMMEEVLDFLSPELKSEIFSFTGDGRFVDQARKHILEVVRKHGFFHLSDVWIRGMHDALQDRCENVPCASIGGLDRRTDPALPDYIKAEEADQYLAGYKHQCRSMWGDDWETCEFGWKHAITILGDEK